MRVFAIASSMMRHLAIASCFAVMGCPGPAVRPAMRAGQLRVLEWTLGGQNAAGPTSPDAYIILIPKDKLAPKPRPNGPKPSGSETKPKATDAGAGVSTVLSECVRATSFLPLSAEDGRILMTIDGAIHALEPRDPSPIRLESQPAELHLTQLIAWRATPDGLEVLAAGQSPQYDDILHSVMIQGTRIVRSGAADVPHENATSFFSAYAVPRCSDAGRSCLRVGNDDEGAYVEEWRRGAQEAPTTLLQIKGAKDAAWAATTADALLVLKTCH